MHLSIRLITQENLYHCFMHEYFFESWSKRYMTERHYRWWLQYSSCIIFAKERFVIRTDNHPSNISWHRTSGFQGKLAMTTRLRIGAQLKKENQSIFGISCNGFYLFSTDNIFCFPFIFLEEDLFFSSAKQTLIRGLLFNKWWHSISRLLLSLSQNCLYHQRWKSTSRLALYI